MGILRSTAVGTYCAAPNMIKEPGRKIPLIDQRLDRLVGVLSDGILKTANKLSGWYDMAELSKPTDQ